jgi:hypothetical protein
MNSTTHGGKDKMETYETISKYDLHIGLMKKLDERMQRRNFYNAIFVEYALLENGVDYLLKCACGKVEKSSLYEKIKKIKSSRVFHNKYLKSKFDMSVLSDINHWKKLCNELVHKCAQTHILEFMAYDGKELVQRFNAELKRINDYFSLFVVNDDGILTNYTGEKEPCLIIPATVKAIADECFYGKDGIKKVVIPSSTKAIGRKAFANMNALEHVTLIYGIKTIQSLAFSNCEKLTKVVIPNSLFVLKAKVDKDAFLNTPYFDSHPDELKKVFKDDK